MRPQGGHAAPPYNGYLGVNAMSPEMTEAEIRQIRTGIQEKYAKVAAGGAGCCFKYPTGKEGMARQGYPMDIIEGLPEEVLADFCGVGNPFGLGFLYPGDAVLDIGCGAGVDSLVAAQLVGPGGRVVGIDVTLAMPRAGPGPPGAAGLAPGQFSGG